MLKKYFRYSFYLAVTIYISSAFAGVYDDFLAAIERDDASAVSALLKRGLDPNTRAPNGQPGLTLALQKAAGKAARALIEAGGIDLDAANEAGETALMIAAIKGDTASASQLVERGAKVNRAGWAPIHYAATGPSVALVTLLLDRGAAIDAESPNQTTALMMAARYGPEDAVRVLLEHGADPRRHNEKGLGCADFARLAGREALAVRLESLRR